MKSPGTSTFVQHSLNLAGWSNQFGSGVGPGAWVQQSYDTQPLLNDINALEDKLLKAKSILGQIVLVSFHNSERILRSNFWSWEVEKHPIVIPLKKYEPVVMILSKLLCTHNAFNFWFSLGPQCPSFWLYQIYVWCKTWWGVSAKTVSWHSFKRFFYSVTLS